MRHSRVKSVIASLILLVSAAPVASDYGPMTLFQLLMANDVAVRGDVTNLEDARYELELAYNFRQSEVPKSLGVIRFDSYPPETRTGDFDVGQFIVLFAVAEGEGLVRPLGRAGEGEIRRDADYVYVQALSRPPTTLTRTRSEDGTYAAYRIDARLFDQAVEGFYGCYRPTGPGRIERICSSDAQESYRGGSWLAGHLSKIAERMIGGED